MTRIIHVVYCEHGKFPSVALHKFELLALFIPIEAKMAELSHSPLTITNVIKPDANHVFLNHKLFVLTTRRAAIATEMRNRLLFILSAPIYCDVQSDFVSSTVEIGFVLMRNTRHKLCFTTLQVFQ